MHASACDYYALLERDHGSHSGNRPLHDPAHLEGPPMGWLWEVPSQAVALMRVRLARIALSNASVNAESMKVADPLSCYDAAPNFEDAFLAEPLLIANPAIAKIVDCHVEELLRKYDPYVALLDPWGSADGAPPVLGTATSSSFWEFHPELLASPCLHGDHQGSLTSDGADDHRQQPLVPKVSKLFDSPLLENAPFSTADSSGHMPPDPCSSLSLVQKEESRGWVFSLDEGEDSTGALPHSAEVWLPVMLPPVLPRLADGDLGAQHLHAILPGVCKRLERPDVEDLLRALPLYGTDQEIDAAPQKENAWLITALPKQALNLTKDKPELVDWFSGVEPLHISLLALGIAALPSIWELEDAPRESEWCGQLSNEHGSSLTVVARTVGGALAGRKLLDPANLFHTGCWRLGNRRLEIIEFQLPTLLPTLEVPEEATALFPGKGELAFAGLSAPNELMRLGDGVPVVVEGTCEESLLAHIFQDGAPAEIRGDVFLPNIKLGGGEGAAGTCDTSPKSASPSEEPWPVRRETGIGCRSSQPAWLGLAVFRSTGQLPSNLLGKSSQETSKLEAHSVAHRSSIAVKACVPHPGHQAGAAVSVSICTVEECNKSVADHMYATLSEERALAEQLQDGIDLIWATYSSHATVAPLTAAQTDPARVRRSSDLPGSTELHALIQRHAETYLRASHAGVDATLDLDLYRVLLALNVLSTLHNELVSSGVLQAAFCADAVMARCPSFLLRNNIWTHQAMLQLHKLIEVPTVCRRSHKTDHLSSHHRGSSCNTWWWRSFAAGFDGWVALAAAPGPASRPRGPGGARGRARAAGRLPARRHLRAAHVWPDAGNHNLCAGHGCGGAHAGCAPGLARV